MPPQCAVRLYPQLLSYCCRLCPVGFQLAGWQQLHAVAESWQECNLEATESSVFFPISLPGLSRLTWQSAPRSFKRTKALPLCQTWDNPEITVVMEKIPSPLHILLPYTEHLVENSCPRKLWGELVWRSIAGNPSIIHGKNPKGNIAHFSTPHCREGPDAQLQSSSFTTQLGRATGNQVQRKTVLQSERFYSAPYSENNEINKIFYTRYQAWKGSHSQHKC